MILFATLDRYIGRSILLTSMLVLLTLVALASIFAFIRELDDVGRGSYTVGKAAQYVILTVPGKAYLLFSPAVLLGSLLGLGALATNSELTVMRAAGISIGRIIRAVLITGVGLMLLIALLGETVMPRSEQVAEELRLTALEEQVSVKGRRGLWLKSMDRYVNIGTVMPDFALLEVSVHQFQSNTLKQALSAQRALPDGDDWLLQKVSVTTINDSRIHSEYIESIHWKDFLRRNSTGEPESVATDNSTELVSADVLKSISVDPESLSASSLYEQIRYLESNELDSRRIELAFWIKIVSPISTIVMLMLSLPFVFSSQRSGGAGQKIFIGIMLGIIYVLLNRLLTQLAMTNGLSPALSAALPLLCFFFVAVIGIRRIN